MYVDLLVYVRKFILQEVYTFKIINVPMYYKDSLKKHCISIIN